jgi:hypothetical protein
MPRVSIVVGDKLLYEGHADLIPNIGDLVAVDDQTHPVESVTWELQDDSLGPVTIRVSELPYGL